MKRNAGLKRGKRIATIALAWILVFTSPEKLYATENSLIDSSMEESLKITEYVEDANADTDIQTGIVDIFGYIRAGNISINWSVGSGVMKQTSEFPMSCGSDIFIYVTLSPSNKKVQVGIIDPDGLKRYINVQGSASYTFSLSKSGTYRVFIANNSATIDDSEYCAKQDFSGRQNLSIKKQEIFKNLEILSQKDQTQSRFSGMLSNFW